MLSRHSINSSLSFSSQSIGDGYINFLNTTAENSNDLEEIVEFVTSPSFLSGFCSNQIVDLIISFINDYPSHPRTLHYLINHLVDSPILQRVSDLIENVPPQFFDDLSQNIQQKVASVFSQSINPGVAELANSYLINESTVAGPLKYELKSLEVSLSDVFNENATDVFENPAKSLTFIEQFQPFTNSDIADFISNLVSDNSSLLKTALSTDSKQTLQLLRPFKSSKLTIDEFIEAFDLESLSIQSPAAFQLFILCIKEVTNARSIPAAPFLGKWNHPLSQLNLVTHIISSAQVPITFPRPDPNKAGFLDRCGSVIIGDFKADHWKCVEFVETLAYLYDHSPNGVEILLEDSIEKGPALLLLVLSINGGISAFARHLTRTLLNCNSQYLPGFTALWARNPEFLVKIIESLYEDQHSLLSRFVDLIDDLNIFNDILNMTSLSFNILVQIAAFFRRGHNFKISLLKLYEKNQDTLNVCFHIFENPLEFGLCVQMKSERKCQTADDNTEIASADLLFFEFIDAIFNSLDKSQKQRVNNLFDKCVLRTPDLANHTFKWRQKVQAPQSPKSPTPAKESEYLEFAVTPDPKCVARYKLYVKSLIVELPKDKRLAQSSGHSIGRLLSSDLLSQSATTRALQLIDEGLAQRENSPGFIFAISAIQEMKDHFDLYLHFARHLIANKQLFKHAPDVHKAIVEACKPPEPKTPRYQVQPDNELELHPRLQRFKYTKIPAKINDFSMIQSIPKSEWDGYALYFAKMEISNPNHYHSAQLPFPVSLRIEAIIFLIHEIITSPDARKISSCSALVRLGRWLGYQTINRSIPLLSSLLDIPKLLLYAYSHSILFSVVPFVYALFESKSNVFNPPNPWMVSILSVLSGIIRLPYLRQSIASTISMIFALFNTTPHLIEPYPLFRLTVQTIYDTDFFYPPIDFTTSLSPVSAEKLFNGDITSLFHIVNQYFTMQTKMEQKLKSPIVREVVFFIHTKVPAIAHSAAITSFSLVLKDFARSNDAVAVERHAKAMILQCVNGLSMIAVALMNDPFEPDVDIQHRNILNANAKWIDLLVRQLAYHFGVQLLERELTPIQKLRRDTENFWDVKSFPPSIALKLPEPLWPKQQSPAPYTRDPPEGSLVASGIYECYNVDPNIKLTYIEFTEQPISISSPDYYPNELPIYPQFANWIFSCFIIDSNTGATVGVRKAIAPKQFMSVSPVLIAATIVYCFPPSKCKQLNEFGADMVATFSNIMKAQQGQLHSLFWQQMPDLYVFAEFVKLDLIDQKFIEVLLMNFIDNPVNKCADYYGVIKLVYEKIYQQNTKQMRPHEFERVLTFLSTHDFSDEELSPTDNEHLQTIKRIWSNYARLEPVPNYVIPSTVEVKSYNEYLHYKSNQQKEFIRGNMNSLIDTNSSFWDNLITSSFPYDKVLLLQFLFASLAYVNPTDNGQSFILQNFLREMFNTTTKGQISMNYFTSVMSNVILHLRVHSVAFAKMFGGFLNDTQPNAHPRFTGAWLQLFPLVVQMLLLDDDIFPPTAKLVVSLLQILNRFPWDWGEREKFRKLYKGILRTILLLVHDAPRFVCGYYFDFVTVIPLHFRRLRNIILCCKPPTEPHVLMSSCLLTRIPPYDKLFTGQFGANEALGRLMTSWNVDGKLSSYEIGRFILYSWRITVRGDLDDSNVFNHPLWHLIRYMLMCCISISNVTVIVECLFDHLRFECAQTKFFVSAVAILFREVDVNWDGISIQDIIYSVMMARKEGVEPIPSGIIDLNQRLSQMDGFHTLFSYNEQENEDD